MLDRLRTSFATTGHAASEGRPGRVRAAAILVAFLALTLPLMPVQRLLLAASLRGARRLPHWYHRQLCRLLGVRLRIEGESADRELGDGDWIMLPAHCRHRVTWTRAEPPTVWLAIHFC